MLTSVISGIWTTEREGWNQFFAGGWKYVGIYERDSPLSHTCNSQWSHPSFLEVKLSEQNSGSSRQLQELCRTRKKKKKKFCWFSHLHLYARASQLVNWMKLPFHTLGGDHLFFAGRDMRTYLHIWDLFVYQFQKQLCKLWWYHEIAQITCH